MNKAKFLIWVGFALIASIIFVFAYGAYRTHTDPKFPITPGGLALRLGCDPDKTYFLQTLANHDYYVPLAAYAHQGTAIPSGRFLAPSIWLELSYPDLKPIISDQPEDNSIYNTISVMAYDKKKTKDTTEFFQSIRKGNKAEKQPKLVDGWEFYTKPSNLDKPAEKRYGQEVYRDPDWKNGAAVAVCGHNNVGCALYVDDDNLAYTIRFTKPMFPDIKRMRDGILKIVEEYRIKPEEGVVFETIPNVNSKEGNPCRN